MADAKTEYKSIPKDADIEYNEILNITKQLHTIERNLAKTALDISKKDFFSQLMFATMLAGKKLDAKLEKIQESLTIAIRENTIDILITHVGYFAEAAGLNSKDVSDLQHTMGVHSEKISPGLIYSEEISEAITTTNTALSLVRSEDVDPAIYAFIEQRANPAKPDPLVDSTVPSPWRTAPNNTLQAFDAHTLSTVTTLWRDLADKEYADLLEGYCQLIHQWQKVITRFRGSMATFSIQQKQELSQIFWQRLASTKIDEGASHVRTNRDGMTPHFCSIIKDMYKRHGDLSRTANLVSDDPRSQEIQSAVLLKNETLKKNVIEAHSTILEISKLEKPLLLTGASIQVSDPKEGQTYAKTFRSLNISAQSPSEITPSTLEMKAEANIPKNGIVPTPMTSNAQDFSALDVRYSLRFQLGGQATEIVPQPPSPSVPTPKTPME